MSQLSKPAEWWAQWYRDRAEECRANAAACGGREGTNWRLRAEQYEAQAKAVEQGAAA